MLHQVLAAPPEPVREIDDRSIELTYWLSPLFSPRELAEIKDKVWAALNQKVSDASTYVEITRGVDEAIVAHFHFHTPRPFDGLSEMFRSICKKVLEETLARGDQPGLVN